MCIWVSDLPYRSLTMIVRPASAHCAGVAFRTFLHGDAQNAVVILKSLSIIAEPDVSSLATQAARHVVVYEAKCAQKYFLGVSGRGNMPAFEACQLQCRCQSPGSGILWPHGVSDRLRSRAHGVEAGAHLVKKPLNNWQPPLAAELHMPIAMAIDCLKPADWLALVHA